ncbi:TPA: hypothetical protein DCX16_01505 [bacterium]|nr:hypothetical protein [bacterium]
MVMAGQSMKNLKEINKLTILVAIAGGITAKDGKSPPNIRLDVWREWQNILEAMTIGKDEYYPVVLTRLFPPTHKQLETALLAHKYDIFHFIGHSGKNGLVLEDEYGSEDIVNIKELSSIFGKEKIRLAIINSCESLAIGEWLHKECGIQTVITTKEPILDAMAKEFTKTLYPSLFGGDSIDEALNKAEDKLSKEFNKQDIFQLIGDSKVTFPLSPSCDKPTVSLGEPLVYNLPYQIGFIGRGKELVEIAKHLANAENRLIALSGVGGIGKTSLAQMVGRRNAWRFQQGGVIFIEVEQRTTCDDILRKISESFKIEQKDVVDFLSMNPCLLIIDNVEVLEKKELKKIGRFLKGIDIRMGTKAIITSRRKIKEFEDIDGSISYTVGEFKEAIDLLLYEAGRYGIIDKFFPYIKEFLIHTRNHPFLIKRAVVVAKTRGLNITLGNLKDLRGDIEEAVSGFIGRMIENISNNAKELIKKLIVFVGWFDSSAVESVCGAKEELYELTETSIIDYDINRDRYHLHQLVLDYVRKNLPLSNEEEESLRYKHAEYYLGIAQGSFDPWHDITIDFENIRQGADWVSERVEDGDMEKEIIELAYDYAFALKGYIYRRSVQEGLRWLLAGVCACKELREEKGEANLYNEIGLRYKSQGNYQEALVWYEKSRKICEEIGELLGLATTYNNIGLIYDSQGNYQEALVWYMKDLEISERIGDQKGLAGTYNNIASIHYAQGNYQEALEWYMKALEISKRIGDQAGLATTYNNIASIHYAQGNYQEALVWYEKSRKIKEKIGDQAGLATTYNNIGLIHKAQGNYQEALVWYEKSIEIFKKIRSWHSMATLLGNIGIIYLHTDKKDIAKQYLQQSYELYLQLNLKSEADKVKQLLNSL